jgi:ABC-type lipopolysaccharide export system ATPase subunit
VSTNGGQYEVLSPWAEVDPIPLKGITPRLSDLKGKNIGLLINGKRASRPILSVVERKLKERYPTATFSYFHPGSSAEAEDVEKREKVTLATWVKTVDAVVLAVGD